MKNAKKLLKESKTAFEGATFMVGGKKVKEGRFFREIAKMIHPPKKRVIRIDTVAKLMRACPNMEVFCEEIKKYVITKGGKLILWEDWLEMPHPVVSKTEDADYEIVVKKLLPNKKQKS